MKKLCDILTAIAVGLFRLAALAVLVCLLVFPAYKGLWLGYVPIALALVACGVGKAVVKRLPGRSLSMAIGAMLFAQVVLLLVLRPVPVLDSLYVLREARTLAVSGEMSPLTYYAPLQTWWYALVFRLCGSSDLVAQLSHLPIAVGCILLISAIGRRVAPGVHSVAALAIYPGFLLFVLTTPYYFYLYAFCVLLAVFFGLKVMEGGRLTLVALTGIAAAAATLTKAVMLLAPAFFGVAWLLTAYRRESPETNARQTGGLQRWVLQMAVFCVAFGLTLAPWVVRNYRVFDAIVPVCMSGGPVLYSANNPDSNGLYSPLPDTVKIETAAEILEHNHECNRLAVEFIREHPRSFLRLMGIKFLHTWGNETTFAETINVRGQEDPTLDAALSGILQTGWSALVLLWACRAGQNLWRRAPASSFEVLVAVLVVANMLVFAVFEGGARHHMPFVPLLILYVAGAGGSARSDSERSSDGKPTALPCG